MQFKTKTPKSYIGLLTNHHFYMHRRYFQYRFVLEGQPSRNLYAGHTEYNMRY